MTVTGWPEVAVGLILAGCAWLWWKLSPRFERLVRKIYRVPETWPMLPRAMHFIAMAFILIGSGVAIVGGMLSAR